VEIIKRALIITIYKLFHENATKKLCNENKLDGKIFVTCRGYKTLENSVFFI